MRPNSRSRFLSIARRIFVRFSVGVTLLLLIVQLTPLIPWYTNRLAGSIDDPDGDVLIVLSGDEMSDGMVGPGSYLRAVYAVRAWRQGHFQAVVVTGGHVSGSRFSLAGSISTFLVGYGVPKDRIFLEERATNTHENALFTQEMIASWPGRKVLLTSDYHMFRARRTFEAAGVSVVPRPFPDVLKWWSNPVNRVPEAWTLFIETGKIAWYWERGWIHLP